MRENILQCAIDLSLKYPNSRFDLAGHSLGGAAIDLLALDLNLLGYIIENLFTYGAPRIGNKAFAQYFSTSIKAENQYRVVHYKDMISHLPPQSFGF